MRTVTLPLMVAQAAATIALGLLAASGVAKLVDPDPTTGAMRAARLPASRLVSHALGVVEVATAVVALVVGGVAVMAAAGLYAAFSVFTFAAARKRIPVQSCGCFGRDDTPPNPIHVAFNVTATAALLAVYLLDVVPVDWGLAAGELVLYLGFAIVGVYASYLLMTRLPQLLALARSS